VNVRSRVGFLGTEVGTIPEGANSGCPGSRSRYAIWGYVLRRVLVWVRESVDFSEDLEPVIKITGGDRLGVVKSKRRGRHTDGVIRIPGRDVDHLPSDYIPSITLVYRPPY